MKKIQCVAVIVHKIGAHISCKSARIEHPPPADYHSCLINSAEYVTARNFHRDYFPITSIDCEEFVRSLVLRRDCQSNRAIDSKNPDPSPPSYQCLQMCCASRDSGWSYTIVNAVGKVKRFVVGAEGDPSRPDYQFGGIGPFR